MRRIVFGLVFAAFAVPCSAQTPLPATDVTAAQMKAFIDKLPKDAISDSPIRVVDVGGSRVGISASSAEACPATRSRTRPSTTEVYVHPRRHRHACHRRDDLDREAAVRAKSGPRGERIEGGVSRHVSPGDVIVIPDAPALVEQPGHRHSLHDCSSRSRRHDDSQIGIGMRGLMMDYPLTIPAIVRRAETLFPDRKVVSRRPDRTICRSTYRQVVDRVRRLAVALAGSRRQAGRPRGDAGVGEPGAPRGVSRDSVDRRGAAHAEPAPAPRRPRLHRQRRGGSRADRRREPAAALREVSATREHRACDRRSADVGRSGPASAGPRSATTRICSPPPIPRAMSSRRSTRHAAAAMCYTSGTTGRPKGVLYSHRARDPALVWPGPASTRWASASATRCCRSCRCSTSTPGACRSPRRSSAPARCLPGPHLDAKSVLELLVRERVTLTAGVPTVWLGVLQELDQHPGEYDLSALRAIVIGGSAAPAAMIRGYKERHGLDIVHAWGMTEMTPLGTLCNLPSSLRDAPAEEQFRYRAKQGTPLPFVEMRASDREAVRHPGTARRWGSWRCAGPWVAAQYYNVDGPRRSLHRRRLVPDRRHRDDRRERLHRADRSRKDLVKSGGEWISSVALETALMGHPCVAEAAVVAVPHPKWDERPLAVVVLKPGHAGDQGRSDRVSGAAVREVVAAGRHRVRGGNPAHVGREVQEVSAARSVPRPVPNRLAAGIPERAETLRSLRTPRLIHQAI